MSLTPIFQRDLFGTDAGLSGWPSDGFDDDPVPVPDVRPAPSARALKVALGIASFHRVPEGPPPEGATPRAD